MPFRMVTRADGHQVAANIVNRDEPAYSTEVVPHAILVQESILRFSDLLCDLLSAAFFASAIIA